MSTAKEGGAARDSTMIGVNASNTIWMTSRPTEQYLRANIK
jgi:hypothetical protein